ncbi:hypothetical protein [Pseudonocardia lacus]|uniref:hypothetical protein n=1 Tax=Pseudonocardia lacus TaxID=2835865 RepID=UPI001BDCB67F|nr:hypothetical protein [Pseudonocardia lacus]
MPRESSSPLCFRLSVQDRRLVETVAAFRGQTLSDYVREIVIEKSAAIVQTEGRDKILRVLQETGNRSTEEQRERYEQGVDHAAPRRP